MTIANALRWLRVDGDYNEPLVQALVDSLPGYIEVTTGMKPEQQAQEPLAETLSGFLLRLWYYGDHADVDKLQRTIKSLSAAVTMKVSRA